jgi:hypothetical protein
MERAMNEPNGERGKRRCATAYANELVAKAEFCQDWHPCNPNQDSDHLHREPKSRGSHSLRPVLQALPGVGKIDFSVERSVAASTGPSQSHMMIFCARLKVDFRY